MIDVNGLHPLTVSKSGTGDGALSADAGSIDCGTECAWLYPEGVEVTLTVHADPNSRFLGWSGDPDCADGVVSMTSPRSCTAEFGQRTTGLGAIVPQLANDLAFSAATGMLYVSVPGRDPVRGNTLTEIDPETGLAVRSVWVGSEPSKLALASDGRSLYVSTSSAHALRRVDLETMTAGPSWDLGLVTFADTVSHAAAGDFAVMPGDPDSVLVGRDGSGLALYRDGVLKPRVGSEFYDRGQLVLAEGGTRAYADTSQSPSTLVRYDVDGEGVTFIDATWDLGGDGARIAFGGGRLYLRSEGDRSREAPGRRAPPDARRPAGVSVVLSRRRPGRAASDGARGVQLGRGDWPGSLRPFDARPRGW